ncbi:MAG: HD domain-containing protein [candidate division WOR-3 bacterium]|jgi:metal-dependent HD superfamily phosphatase/phosphodiesterase|nr:HD domain-containing protein [candidate division WOR-3 bacterium]MCR4423363.1 HD domain-containing protein [candidate division WOR-3 bacterium]MDH7518702.1 HD domain-containing protein [bacterium]
MVTLREVKKDPEAKALITEADRQLAILGYTEHGHRHARLVAKNSRSILIQLGYDEKVAELSAIAGYLHDIGNVVNRQAHERTSALLAREILVRLGMEFGEVAQIMAAIGNHHEEGGNPVSEIAAALILADKADVHRSRVRNPALIKFDIHDRVNFAVKKSTLSVDSVNHRIVFDLHVDTGIAPVMEYFEIFLSRMLISRRAADFLRCRFELVINGTKLV